MSWKDLDIKLKAELIKLGVRSGIKDIKLIRLLYDNNNNSISDYSSNSYIGNETELVNNATNELQINQEELFINGLIQEYNLIELQDNYIMDPNVDAPPLNLSTTGEYLQLFKNGGYKDGNDKTKNEKNKTYGPYELPAVVITPDSQYNEFINSLPDNHKYTPEEEYRMYKYWQLWGKPKNFLYTLDNPNEDGDYMFNWDTSDSSYHGSSIAWGDDGVGYFIKPKHHETLKYELDYFNKGLITEEGGIQRPMTPEEQKEWEDFKSRYTLKDDGNFYKYVPKAKGGYISNNPTLASVGKVKKYSKGGYENPDEPPVSESTYVEQPPLNILELELLNYLLSNPTAEQEYFRNLAIQNMASPQSNLGVILTKEEQDLVDKAFLEYNNFRYSHPWAEGLGYTPVIGDAMDLISIAGDVNNKNYMSAGLGLGMLALPNFIEKPIKKSNLSTLNTIIENATQQSPLQEKMTQQMYADELLGKGWSNKIALKDNKKYLQPIHVNLLDDQVLKRMRRNNFQKDSDIEKIKRGLFNIPYYEYPKEYFDKAGYPTTSGWYLPWDNRIIHNISVPSIKVLPHEYRHLIDLYYPLNSSNKIYLNRAYKDYFKNLNLTTKDGFDSDISDEMVTTNLEARMLLFEGKKINQDGEEIDLVNAPLDVLDRFILNATKEEILDALRKSNLYGLKFVQFLKNKGDEYIEQKLPYIRDALYKVPAIIPFGLMSHKLFNQNNKEENKNGGYIFPNNAFQHKFDDGGYTKHSIAKGDTLSDISRKYNVKMDAILTANPDIKDPNLIYAGDNIYIPKKVQNFIPKEEIPRRNELLQEITDYSKDFDYIIEGEKIYYSRKGKNNYVDISHNEKARRNLFNHIAKKEFNGYNNGEKELYEKIKNNTYSYGDYNPHSNYDNPIPGYEYVSTPNGLELRRKKQVQELEKEEKVEKTESVSKLDFGYSKEQKDYINSLMQLSSEDLKKEVEDKENSFNPFDYLELIGPGIKRMWNKHVTQGKNDPITNIDRSNWELPESAYALRPDSYVGDTVSNGDRRYIVPESIKVDDYTYGYRNRGDYSSIDSESAGITAFTSFEPYGQHVKGRNTYIGIDSLGNLKVGDEYSFSDGDFLTPTFSNDIAYFMKDSDGNIVQSKSTKNPRLNLPAYALWNNGNIIEKPTGQAVNILIRKDDKKGTQYGNITGGRVLVKVGNEMRLLSGSMSDIDKEFEEMKKRNNAEYGTFYTLDNGSYNRGLRTYDSKFTELDLKEYDRLNAGGGNFLYVKDKKILQDLYPSDTIWTPNVRTVEDESYKKGHDIVNEVLGAVFHHTASTDPDLTGVTKLLTSKNGNSAHVVIGHGGERVVLAKPELVTFHAGLSMHNGRDNVNDFMIGIEFQGVTQTYDKKEGKYKKGIPLTEDLINSAVEYLKPIIKQYQIPLENLVTHLLIRDSYNDYMKKTKGKQAEVKPDIHYDDYQRIINKLLEEVYYKK